ncbi:MAG: hypothetical protein NDJ94_15840 [Vicinamibacteria bacterium]|nr:hypothetical protein [Vicinamibacteria bacterium]
MFAAIHVPGGGSAWREPPDGGAGGTPDSLLSLAREFTPRVEPDPSRSDLVVLALTGLGRLWKDPAELGRALLAEAVARGLGGARLAIALTRTAARTLALAREGFTLVPPGGEAEALAPLPLRCLELDAESQRALARWGVRTLGELQRLPAVGLSQRLGPLGPRLRRRARGEDERPLAPAAEPDVFEASLEVEWPVAGLEPLSFLLARVLEALCRGLRARGRKAMELTLTLSLADSRQDSRTLRMAAPSAEPRAWRALLLLDLEARLPGEAALGVHVRAVPTPARAVQFSLLDPAQPAPERLAETLARLAPFSAAGRAGAPRLQDSHRPDAFVLGPFAPGPADASRRIRAPLWAKAALRALRPPVAAEVVQEQGAPVRVQSAVVRGAVVDRAGPWRASGDWWDQAWSREEWDVAVAGGVWRIFRDTLRGGWYVAGEVD